MSIFQNSPQRLVKVRVHTFLVTTPSNTEGIKPAIESIDMLEGFEKDKGFLILNIYLL